MPTTATPQNYVWEDCSVISPSAINPTGPDGSMTVITDPASYIGALLSDAVGESCQFQLQVSHQHAPGTDVKPHIHIVRCDASDNTGNCEFEAKFRVLPVKGAAFAWTSNVAGSTALQPADGADNTGLISWTLANSTYNFGPSDNILCVVRRSGTTTGAIALTSADLHIQKGPFGTVNEGDRLAG
jgi:hypothetical protein